MQLLYLKFLYVLFNFLALFITAALFGDDTVSGDMYSEEASLNLLAIDSVVKLLSQEGELENGTNFNFGVFVSFLHDLYQHNEASFVIDRYHNVYNLKFSDERKDQIYQLRDILRSGDLTLFTKGHRRIPSLYHHISLNEDPYDHINRIHIDLEGQSYHLTLVIDHELNMTSKLFVSSRMRMSTSLFVNSDSSLNGDIESCSFSLISDGDIDEGLSLQIEELQTLLKNIYKLFNGSISLKA